jgi:signal transduction histidine kinase
VRRISHIIIIDLILFILCGLGVYRFAQNAGIPFELVDQNGSLAINNISSEAARDLKNGDILISLAGRHVISDDEGSLLCDQYPVGSSLPAEISRNGKIQNVSVQLINDYNTGSIIIETCAGAIFFFVGLFVALRRNKERSAIAFHDLSVSIAALILLTTGYFGAYSRWLGYGLEFAFNAAYIAVPILFLHFTLEFPRKIFPHTKKILIPVIVVGTLLFIWLDSTFWMAAFPQIDIERYGLYDAAFTCTRLFFVILFFTGLSFIFYSFRKASEDFERRKILWIFFGIAFGVFDYIFLDLIPKITMGKAIISEDAVLGISVIAPISFAIAIIRYRIFDIDLFLKRSTVYTLVIGLLLGIYLGVVWLVTQLLLSTDLPAFLPNVAGALLIALLFEPLRKRMQLFIDRKFFRISYNFHEAQRSFLDEIKFVTTRASLANLVTTRIDSLLPVTKLGFFVMETPGDRLRLLAHHHFEILEGRHVRLEMAALKTGLELPVACEDMIEPGIMFEPADLKVFRRWGMALALPMLSSNHQILGFLVLGEKLSGSRFSLEDISLLLSVSTQTGLALERLKVEYALMVEQAESERLNELSNLKSYFVSSVSHDLKTPLTSIRLFAEFLKEHENLPRQKAMEYLGIIEGESDRLSRLITSVLDFAKVEKGTKEYHLKRNDLNEIAQNVLHSLEYQISSRGFEVQTTIHDTPLLVEADSDAVFDVMTNLISNAMKYSPPDRKHISVLTNSENGYAILSVEDKGYGIAEIEIDKIFESFYRINDEKMKSAGGAGLGLSLVKHTMDAHRGRVEVNSEIGKGSIFALYFPLYPHPHEENPDR